VFKILWAEDHPAQRELLAQMLRLNGFEVAVASNGLEAVEKTVDWVPDLILMDLRMPVMDGFEAIRVIRARDSTQMIPIIAVSVWATAKHRERALAAGANELIAKPVDSNQLIQTIHQYLGLRVR
jgi:CheY-like chemotaxis protein